MLKNLVHIFEINHYAVDGVDKEAVCVGDEALLYRLVCILMDNAIKYCDNEGEITAYKKDGTHIGFKVVL